MMKKTCTSCRVEKTIAEFHHYGKNGERVGKWCEECYQQKTPSVPPGTEPTLPAEQGSLRKE